MIWWLLACGPGAKELCQQAERAEESAWTDVADYYERREALTGAELETARAEVDAATKRREQAERSRATYATRSRSGLTDMRTGELHADASANAANRRRAAGAAARGAEEAAVEARALADWLVADHAHDRTLAGGAVARDVLDGRRPPSDGRDLVETTLASTALAASRERAARCDGS